MFAPSSPITGAAVTGLTTPTFTLTADTQRSDGTKVYLVSSLGGTQTGVVAHTPDTPFLVTGVKKPYKSLPPVNSLTGKRPGAIPKNVQQIRVEKSVLIDSSSTERDNLILDITLRTPAGAAAADANSVRSAISCATGMALAQVLADGALLGQF